MKRHPNSVFKCPSCSYKGNYGTFKMRQVGSIIEFDCPECGEMVWYLDVITNERFNIDDVDF